MTTGRRRSTTGRRRCCCPAVLACSRPCCASLFPVSTPPTLSAAPRRAPPPTPSPSPFQSSSAAGSVGAASATSVSSSNSAAASTLPLHSSSLLRTPRASRIRHIHQLIDRRVSHLPTFASPRRHRARRSPASSMIESMVASVVPSSAASMDACLTKRKCSPPPPLRRPPPPAPPPPPYCPGSWITPGLHVGHRRPFLLRRRHPRPRLPIVRRNSSSVSSPSPSDPGVDAHPSSSKRVPRPRHLRRRRVHHCMRRPSRLRHASEAARPTPSATARPRRRRPRATTQPSRAAPHSSSICCASAAESASACDCAMTSCTLSAEISSALLCLVVPPPPPCRAWRRSRRCAWEPGDRPADARDTRASTYVQAFGLHLCSERSAHLQSGAARRPSAARSLRKLRSEIGGISFLLSTAPSGDTSHTP